MNLTRREVYQKSPKANKLPTAKQRAKWERIRALGCRVGGEHGGHSELHHIETGMGRKKNHDRVICLCYNHHRGKDGFHTLGSKIWELIHGKEAVLFELQEALLEELLNPSSEPLSSPS